MKYMVTINQQIRFNHVDDKDVKALDKWFKGALSNNIFELESKDDLNRSVVSLIQKPLIVCISYVVEEYVNENFDSELETAIAVKTVVNESFEEEYKATDGEPSIHLEE